MKHISLPKDLSPRADQDKTQALEVELKFRGSVTATSQFIEAILDRWQAPVLLLSTYIHKAKKYYVEIQ